MLESCSFVETLDGRTRDLVNEGVLGLIKAVKRFDEQRGVRLLTYAVWWIRQAITQALATQSRTVRIPDSHRARLRRITHATSGLEQRLGRTVTPTDLADELGLSATNVAATLARSAPLFCMDQEIGEDPETRWTDCLVDNRSVAADTSIIDDERRDHLRAAIKHLSERQRQVLTFYYGLDGRAPLTLAQISRRFAVTPERIRQVKNAAIEHLRRAR